jgi:hypothetical protein
MPINSCSINAFTIDSLKCRRANVVPPQPITGKSHPYHTRIDPRSWQEHEQIDITKLEGPNIRLAITIDGEVHAATYENNFTEMRPLVTVSNLSINNKDDLPTIKVIDLNIKPANR